MKKLKQMFCILLAASVLFLVACGNGTGSSGLNGEITKGKYVEKEITPPVNSEGTLFTLYPGENKITVFTGGLLQRFDSQDGGNTWQESEGPGAANSELANTTNLAMFADGSLLAAIQEEVNEQGIGKVSFAKVMADGTVEPFSISEFEDTVKETDYVYISTFKILSQDRIHIDFSGGDSMQQLGEEEQTGEEPAEDNAEESKNNIFTNGGGFYQKSLLLDEQGNQLAELSADGILATTSDAERIYMLNYEGQITAYNIADGSAVKDYSAKAPVEQSADGFIFDWVMLAGENGTLYLGNKNAMYKMEEGKEATELFSAAAFSYSSNTNTVTDAAVMQDNALIIGVQNQNASQLFRCEYDENAVNDPSKTIKVWSLYNDVTVRAAIAQLAKVNPDVAVEYETALTGDDTAGIEDAIRNLNTRIMNGDGPDVIILDGVPAQSYKNNGMLLGLSSLLDTKDVYQTLKESYETDKGLFMVPTRFKIPVLVGEAQDLQQNDTLEKLVENAVNGPNKPLMDFESDNPFSALPQDQRPVISPDTLEEVLSLLWDASEKNILADNKIDKESLRRYLEAAKSLSDKYNLQDSEGGMAAMSTGDGSDIITGSVLAYMSQRAVVGAFNLSSISMVQFFDSVGNTSYVSLPGTEQGSWTPISMAAVNASSKKQDLAVQFVQTMLSKEVQGSTGGGLPVTQEGVQKQVDDINTLLKNYGEPEISFDMDAILQYAKYPIANEKTIQNVVADATESYCAGEIDLEGAISKVEQETKNYLAERQ